MQRTFLLKRAFHCQLQCEVTARARCHFTFLGVYAKITHVISHGTIARMLETPTSVLASGDWLEKTGGVVYVDERKETGTY